MEQSLLSLSFRGSIAEAIAEAKQQKKLFVVYTAGDNPDSKLLETSTWIDPKVSETVSKYCILLHILEGSSEALNFSAIYPQQCFPCITAVGYNGVLLWQKEGFVNADMLASSLERAWLSLHVQETTAAFLSAALAKQAASGSSEVHEQVREGTGVSTSTTDGANIAVDAGRSLHSETKENVNSNNDSSKVADSRGDDVALPEQLVANVIDNGELDKSSSQIETGNASKNPIETDQKNPKVALPVPDVNNDVGNSHLSISRKSIEEASEVAQVNTKDALEVENAEASNSSTVRSNDIFLNIRLPDSSSLQVKFVMTDTLKRVKDHINENQTSSLGSFGIAIPYPRKVFSDQDMDSTLSELGLSHRQALIVVPLKQNNSRYRGESSQYQNHSSNEAGSSNASEGYWGSVKRILSYANVLSYFGRSNSTSVTQESQSGLWQYSPNPSLQNSLRDGGRPSATDQAAPTTASDRNNNSKSRRLTSSFGGNIHTLKHDEDDERFSDRNAFWNGNSTQYGGNDDGK